MNRLQQVLTLVRALPPPPLSHGLRRVPLQDHHLCFSHSQQGQKSLGGAEELEGSPRQSLEGGDASLSGSPRPFPDLAPGGVSGDHGPSVSPATN